MRYGRHPDAWMQNEHRQIKMFSKKPNILRRLVAQTTSWMLPGKEDILLQGVPIEKRIW
jgi:hypothetical protein